MHWLIGGIEGPETHLLHGIIDWQPLNKIHLMPASLAKNVKFLQLWSWKHKYWQFSELLMFILSDSIAITLSTIKGHTVPLCTKSQSIFMPFVMAKKLKNDNMFLTMVFTWLLSITLCMCVKNWRKRFEVCVPTCVNLMSRSTYASRVVVVVAFWTVLCIYP